MKRSPYWCGFIQAIFLWLLASCTWLEGMVLIYHPHNEGFPGQNNKLKGRAPHAFQTLDFLYSSLESRIRSYSICIWTVSWFWDSWQTVASSVFPSSLLPNSCSTSSPYGAVSIGGRQPIHTWTAIIITNVTSPGSSLFKSDLNFRWAQCKGVGGPSRICYSTGVLTAPSRWPFLACRRAALSWRPSDSPAPPGRLKPLYWPRKRRRRLLTPPAQKAEQWPKSRDWGTQP